MCQLTIAGTGLQVLHGLAEGDTLPLQTSAAIHTDVVVREVVGGWALAAVTWGRITCRIASKVMTAHRRCFET